MVSQLAVAGSVEDEELGLVSRGGVVLGAEAVFEGFVVGGELAESCLRLLASVGYGGLAIGELGAPVLDGDILLERCDLTYLTEVKSVVFPPPLGPSRRMVGSCLGAAVR